MERPSVANDGLHRPLEARALAEDGDGCADLDARKTAIQAEPQAALPVGIEEPDRGVPEPRGLVEPIEQLAGPVDHQSAARHGRQSVAATGQESAMVEPVLAQELVHFRRQAAKAAHGRSSVMGAARAGSIASKRSFIWHLQEVSPNHRISAIHPYDVSGLEMVPEPSPSAEPPHYNRGPFPTSPRWEADL